MGLFVFITYLFTASFFSNANCANVINDHLTGSPGLYVTPTGITIESVYASNWETYVNGEIAAGRVKYTAHYCTLPDNCVGLFCDKNGPNNCTSAFDCTYCSNCPENN